MPGKRGEKRGEREEQETEGEGSQHLQQRRGQLHQSDSPGLPDLCHRHRGQAPGGHQHGPCGVCPGQTNYISSGYLR